MTTSRSTGRPESPLPGSGALYELARELRQLRDEAGLTYRQLAPLVNYSPTALSRATSGKLRPSWDVVSALVEELDGDLDRFRDLWEQAGPAPAAIPRPRGSDDATRRCGPTATDSTVPPEPTVASRSYDDDDDRDLCYDGSVPNPPSQLQRPWRWLPAGVAVLVAILTTCAIMVANLYLAGPRIAPQEPTPGVQGNIDVSESALILSPADTQESVPQTVALRGEYSNLRSGEVIWAVTQDMSKNLYFPQDRACNIRVAGAFDCGTYYVGKQDAPDSGTYRILIVSARSEAVNVFIKYQIDKGGPLGPNPGLTGLPEGVEVLAARTIRRV